MELIPVSWQSSRRWLSHKPGGRLPLLSTRPAVTFPAKTIAPWPVFNYTAWWQRHTGCPRPLRGGAQPELKAATCELQVLAMPHQYHNRILRPISSLTQPTLLQQKHHNKSLQSGNLGVRSGKGCNPVTSLLGMYVWYRYVPSVNSLLAASVSDMLKYGFELYLKVPPTVNYLQCHTSLPAQHLRPSGLFSCRPHSLELSLGFYLEPDHQCRLFQTFA